MSDFDFLKDGRMVQVTPSGHGRTRQGVVRGTDTRGLFLERWREYGPDGWREDEPTVPEFFPWPSVARIERMDAAALKDIANTLAAGSSAPENTA